ncbi:MAG: hypothetical protein GWN58_31800 [Anaerolineae bacterium]|nr:hypothetical protein [Anaerolineae bacterium]
MLKLVFALLTVLTKRLAFNLWHLHEASLRGLKWAEAREQRLKAERTVFEQHLAKKPKCTGVEGSTILTEEHTSSVKYDGMCGGCDTEGCIGPAYAAHPVDQSDA